MVVAVGTIWLPESSPATIRTAAAGDTRRGDELEREKEIEGAWEEAQITRSTKEWSAKKEEVGR